MAVERKQRIKEDTSTAKRNLYCEVRLQLSGPWVNLVAICRLPASSCSRQRISSFVF